MENNQPFTNSQSPTTPTTVPAPTPTIPTETIFPTLSSVAPSPSTNPEPTAPPLVTPPKKSSSLKPILFNLLFAFILLAIAAISLKLFLIDDQVPVNPQELLNTSPIPSASPSPTTT